MKIGSLFSGAGGLDMAVEQVFGAETAWHCELDPAASKVLAERWPGVPNWGDITEIYWGLVEPVDILCGGFPCQDVSAAGRRAGIREGTRSGLWSHFAEAIDTLRPRYVVIENVRGLLSAKAHRAMESDPTALGDGTSGPILRALGAVLGDLADIGYDAQWTTVAASDIGSCHKRERVFIVAHPASDGRHKGRPESARIIGRPDAAVGSAAPLDLLPTPTGRDGKGANQRGDDTCLHGALLPTPGAADITGGGANPDQRAAQGHHVQLIDAVLGDAARWGKCEPAIRRWESLTRPAPAPTEPNTKGNPRLAAPFPEWMMGWPEGWATQVDGLSRNDQLRIIGNGVVPQQATAALQWLLSVAHV